MKNLLPSIASALSIAPIASSFNLPGGAGAADSLVNLSPAVERDVYPMADWAANSGVQQAEGVQLTSYDGKDYFPVTQAACPAGSPVMYVPNNLIMTSSKAAQEFGASLSQCENKLVAAGLEHQVPLFRVFFKIIAEYEKGDQSPWFPWLNSLPRLFNNGASMTYECFDCLPPYASYVAFVERQDLINFKNAVGRATPQQSPFTPEMLNGDILRWAYSVAVTRSIEVNGERFLAPMIDMFNHGSEPEVEISFDGSDCYAYATCDIPAGSPLRVSYGDSRDPTPLFAKYGFLDHSSGGTFCKLMKELDEINELGYSFADLLFYKNGDISPEVYDVILYSVLKQNDPSLAQSYYQAVTSGDVTTKNQYQEQYWSYTKEKLQNHVDGLLGDLDQWARTASSYDLDTHPRAPLILEHNHYVKETFLAVKSQLDNM